MDRDPPQVVGQVVEVAGTGGNHEQQRGQSGQDPASPAPARAARAGSVSSPTSVRVVGALDFGAECIQACECAGGSGWLGFLTGSRFGVGISGVDLRSEGAETRQRVRIGLAGLAAVIACWFRHSHPCQ